MVKNLILLCLLSFCLPLINNRLFLLFTVFLRSFVLVLWVGVNIRTPFATVTFLVYISGLLVVFSYLIAINPNFLYKQPSIKNFFLLANFLLFGANKDLVLTNPVNVNPRERLAYMFNHRSIGLYIRVAIFLLICLVGVVSICYKSPKPLRGLWRRRG